MSTTATREIPRAEWVRFLDTFSRRHERWLVTIEIFAAEVGAQVEGRSLRFEGMGADLKDGERRITISLGESPASHLTHTIEAPTRLWLGQSEAELGTFETLEIESEDGVTTLVRFLAGVVPDGSLRLL